MDEADRLAALRRYRILDTEPEQRFDDLTFLASQVCNTPMATITLVDDDRQWFKSRVNVSVEQTSRSVSFCSHAIKQREIMIVPDATKDARFSSNPMVLGDPHIRFYAGTPLITPDGYPIGTLCVVDRVPRELTPEQVKALVALRHQAEAQLELRINLIELREALAERDAAEAASEKLIAELRHSLDSVNKLAGLMQFCSTCQMNLTLPAVPSSIHRVSEGITQMLGGKGWNEDEIIKIDLALQEALANGIRHGARNDPSKFVQCVVTTDLQGDLLIVVRDPGPGFDPSRVPDPLEGDNIFKASGRGVFLINQLMDEVAFADGGREVHMKKRRGP
jgi:anti-sigma regulatory factor (Ser/Thr protein kinase)